MPVIDAGLWLLVNLELLRSANGISDVTQILRQVSKLMFFNVENPTGRYRPIRLLSCLRLLEHRLDLSNPSEYAVAESLVSSFWI